MASLTPARDPSPVHPGAGRGAGLPRDAGRATEVLYKRHSRTVFRYAWHLLGRREDAEDATQATFLSVHAALASGTAVLESGAWVLRIARNECMSRLRQRARVPAAGELDAASERPAPGGVEQSADLRAELSTARKTLNSLPVLERDAFVLREWIGLDPGEVALALGLTATAVEGLTGRARRSLVLAVGGLEPAVGCVGTRAALESGSIDRAGKVHLLRCPMCRGVRRALRSPESAHGSLVPAGIIAERLADALPGFATGGGGIVAALVAKGAAAPILVKAGAALAAAVVTVGVAGHEVQRELRPTHPAATAPARGGEARVLSVPVIAKIAPVALVPTNNPPHESTATTSSHARKGRSSSRGGAATSDGRSGSGSAKKEGGGGSSGEGTRSEGGDLQGGGGSQPSQSGKSTDDGGGSSVGSGKSIDNGGTKGSVGGKVSGSDDTTSSDSGKGGGGGGADDSGTSSTVGSGDDSSTRSSGSGSGDGGGDSSSGSGSSGDERSSHGGAITPVTTSPADPSAEPSPVPGSD